MERRTSLISILLGSALLAGCPSAPLKPPSPVSSEGFEPFATPRSFNGPGTIFRLDEAGKLFPVAGIRFEVQEGVEVIPKMTFARVLSLSQFLEALGASTATIPASVRANLSRTTTANVESTTAKRRYVFDEDIEPAMLKWASTAKPIGGSTYFLIRETIVTPGLVYKVDRNWLASLNVDIKVLKAAGYTVEPKGSSADTLEMSAVFSEPLNVWFKAERITLTQPLGGAPGNYQVARVPVSASVLASRL